MKSGIDRREFLRLAGIGGAVFASGLGFDAVAAERRGGAARKLSDFYFVQLSDTHWGFNNPTINPDAAHVLPKAIDAINHLSRQPDFIMFTGDLTHSTDDAELRRRRMHEFKQQVEALSVKDIKFIPGEHDASLDNGAAFQEIFGATYYYFRHKGVHFFALDNVSDPTAQLGQTQLDWLAGELAELHRSANIVVFAHRPLFDLYPQWDWYTKDGKAVLDLLSPFQHVAVFYGHIHQQHYFETGYIKHFAANSLIFPLPVPGSAPKKVPIPWNAAKPYAGLGFRNVHSRQARHAYELLENTIV